MAIEKSRRDGQRRRSRPGVEGLETRQLMTVVINESPINSDFSTGTLPAAITTGPDGNIWFTDLAKIPGRLTYEGAVGFINPTTHVSNQISLDAFDTPVVGKIRPGGIVAGPDGNIWFTDPTEAKIGEINPTTLALNEFPIPSKNSGIAAGIAAGSDGNLWFTEPSQNAIDELNPQTRAVREFILPRGGSDPIGITAGPDGNLWFTENGTGMIGEINPTSGAISEFAAPTAGAKPIQIAAGPDGNLWFSEQIGIGTSATFKIGEINPTTGATADFAAPADSGVAAGPDGNVWFTEQANNAVGSINPTTHAIATYQAGTTPSALVTGPDGNVWINSADTIGSSQVVLPNEASIQGIVLSDPAANGTLEGGTLANQTVYLDLNDSGILTANDPTATTDAHGQYTFNNLAPGTYIVRVATFPIDTSTGPAASGQVITAVGGQVTIPKPFGLVATSSLLPLTASASPFGTDNPGPSTAELTGLFNTILANAPDPAVFSSELTALQNGGNLRQVAAKLFNSSDYQSESVQTYYQDYLGRSPTTAELNAWVYAMNTGTSQQQVATILLQSSEFSQDHPGNSDFVATLYGDVLGRQPTAVETNAWDAFLNAGGTRGALVEDVVYSIEAADREVDGFYSVFLGRTPDTTELNRWVASIFKGVSPTTVAIVQASSAEFVKRADKTIG